MSAGTLPVSEAADQTAQRRRARSGRALWAGVAVAVLLVAGGIAVAVAGYAATDSADGVVHAYFGALERADAPDALSYGPVPHGSHALLTSTFLAEQEDAAPLGDVSVSTARPTSSSRRVVVPVSYTLTFPSGPQRVRASMALHRAGGDWRLDSSAVVTRLELSGAAQRATLDGGAVPEDTVAMFPGAVPLRFDTPYLAVGGRSSVVPRVTDTRVHVVASRAGRRDMTAATVAALRKCLAGRAPDRDDLCPLPDARYIPGSLRGSVTGPAQRVSVTVSPVDVGELDIRADVPVHIRYRRLDFHGEVTTGDTSESITVTADAAAVHPLAIQWTPS